MPEPSYQFKEFCDDWLSYAKEGDYESYQVFLEEVQKVFTRLYAEATMPEAVSLVEAVLRTTSCELKENNIKYKGKMAKKVIEMTNEELKKAREKGREWLIKNEEVTGTGKTRNGIGFDAKLFESDLRKIEAIEREIKERSLA